jgi:deoxyribodipyrimidine photo-lyase
MSASNILIYLVRRDLRVSDNPILHHLSTTSDHRFTHLLPVYVFASHQIEVSGFIKDGSKSPYAEAKSCVGRFWRCGPHRAKIITSSVWDMKKSMEELGSGLVIRAGQYGDILKALLSGLQEDNHKVGAVWITADEGVEEKRDEKALAAVCADSGIEFKVWADEKYFIDE